MPSGEVQVTHAETRNLGGAKGGICGEEHEGVQRHGHLSSQRLHPAPGAEGGREILAANILPSAGLNGLSRWRRG